MTEPAVHPGELTALDQAIAALEGQRAVLGDLVVETALAPLIEKRDRLLAASVGEQLKLVTVLFADLVDSTPLAQRLDAEDLQQVMSRYFAAVRSAVEAEGGTVEKFIGDAAMAVFGLYRSKEDDATRAVRAALAMLTALEELNVQIGATLGVHLQMRVGVDTGEMVVTGMAER
jgi:class 3 adenylate cyclase